MSEVSHQLLVNYLGRPDMKLGDLFFFVLQFLFEGEFWGFGGGGSWFAYVVFCNFHPYLGKWCNLTNIFSIGWFNHPLPGSIWLNVLFFPLFAGQVTFRVSNPNSRVAVAPEISKKIHDGSWWIHRGPLGPLGPLPPAGWGRWLVFTWFFHLMDWVRQTISSYLSELWNDEKKHRRDREFHGYKHKGQRKRIDDDEEDDTVRYWMFHGKQDEIYIIYIVI